MFVRQMSYLVALSRENHFGRAAEKCYATRSEPGPFDFDTDDTQVATGGRRIETLRNSPEQSIPGGRQSGIPGVGP